MNAAAQNSFESGVNYSYVWRRRRTKIDWAGITPADAFRSTLDYWLKLPAQRMFYDAMRNVQRSAAELAGESNPNVFKPKIKPQLGPLHANYPLALAVPAALGLTAYLEYRTRVGESLLATHMQPYLEDPIQIDDVTGVDAEAYKALARMAVERVQTRLFLRDLAGNAELNCVEQYRLFMASQQLADVASFDEIITAAVLFGDLRPYVMCSCMHPISRHVYLKVEEASRIYLDMLALFDDKRNSAKDILHIGQRWVRAIARALAPFLPRAAQPSQSDNADQESWQSRSTPRIAPLSQPRSPNFVAPSSDQEQLLLTLGAPTMPQEILDKIAKESGRKELKVLSDFVNQVAKVSQQETWEDMRSDRVTAALRRSVFQQGPLQGTPIEGHSVTVNLGDDWSKARGELFDQPVPLSDDYAAIRKLEDESRPIAEALSRSLWPNFKEQRVLERFRSSGNLDPGRLPLAGISEAVYRRSKVSREPDRRGAPLLLLACDSSASLSSQQMNMMKLLSTAWLISLIPTRVKFLAGLYHSARNPMDQPFIAWLFHPRKTPASGRRDAIRAIASLPNEGSGSQRDALSLGFMIEEAFSLATGNVYVVIISDLSHNKSFHDISLSGEEEVHRLFCNLKEKHNDRLRITVVSLDANAVTEKLAKVVDDVIAVTSEELNAPATVAEKIGEFVARRLKDMSWLKARQ